MTPLERIETLLKEMETTRLKRDFIARVFVGRDKKNFDAPYTAFFLAIRTDYDNEDIGRQNTETALGKTMLEAVENLYWKWLKLRNDETDNGL